MKKEITMEQEMQVTPFLMFTGQAQAAIDFYLATIPSSKMIELKKYEQHTDQSQIGKVMIATIELGGQQFKCIDSPPVHKFDFTPSFSIMLECDSANEVDRIYATLAQEGAVFMPLDSYPFARRYAWVNDRFGVSWQVMFN